MYSCYYILISLSVMCGLYLVADHLDEIHHELEDKYLPPRYRWQVVSFKISFKEKCIKPKKKLVKFEAYWMRRVAQFFLMTYVVILIIGRSVTQSFDFVVKSWVGWYPMLAFTYPAISNIIVWIYTRVRSYREKRL